MREIQQRWWNYKQEQTRNIKRGKTKHSYEKEKGGKYKIDVAQIIEASVKAGRGQKWQSCDLLGTQ